MTSPKQFNLSPLHQVEYAVGDLKKAQNFFQHIFGESEVEAAFSSVLNNPALDISHAGFGETVQQFCQPLMEGLPHYDLFQTYGNCVHNLCYLVDSIDDIIENCRLAGFDQLIDFPLDDIWRSVLPEENLQGNHQSYIMDTRATFGFHLELAETPWVNLPEPPLMLPAFSPAWQELGVASGNKVLGLNIVVADLEQTLAALQTVFANNLQVHREPETSADESSRTMVVELGLVRMAFLQPIAKDGELQEFLSERGPAVHSILASVADMSRIRTELEKSSIEVGAPNPILFAPLRESGYSEGKIIQTSSIEQQGVNFILVELE